MVTFSGSLVRAEMAFGRFLSMSGVLMSEGFDVWGFSHSSRLFLPAGGGGGGGDGIIPMLGICGYVYIYIV